MQSLAIKYRPKEWKDLIGQDTIKQILQAQLDTKTTKNAYLFVGSAGTGKTTSARIFANEINNGNGNPIEIDAASNNSVDNVRKISQQAKLQSLDSEFKIYIVDECFPSNTKIVMADNKSKCIKDVVIGDKVKSMTGTQEVTHLFKQKVPVERLCCVIVNNKKIITTVDHLFFTNQGWVSAKNLKKGDIVYDSESVSELWERTSDKQPQECKDSKMCNMWKRVSNTELLKNKNLFKDMQRETNFKVAYTDEEYRVWNGTTETIIRKNEETQPYGTGSDYSEDVTDKRTEWNTSSMETRKQMWQWKIYNSSNDFIQSLRKWMDIRISDKNKMSKRFTHISYLLQSRPCLSVNETCSRGGWQRTSIEKSIITGCKENKISGVNRVESVEIYKSGNNGELFRSCFTSKELSELYVTMYDLEVTNDHCYFANDVLVHNCHSLSSASWQAMLKLIEEPPAKTKFIFCTTEAQKIPKTILSRVQRYDFQRISVSNIVNRLTYVIEQENASKEQQIDYDVGALEYIAKLAEGGMRDSLTMLDKCISYSNTITIDTIIQALGISDYTTMFKLTDAFIYSEIGKVLDIVEDIYTSGKDLKTFIKSYLTFILDICKYNVTKDFKYLSIPNTEKYNSILQDFGEFDFKRCLKLLDVLVKLNSEMRWENSPKALFISNLLLECEM